MEIEPMLGVDVDKAWERFKEKVQNEPASAVWSQGLPLQSSATAEASTASPNMAESTSAELNASEPSAAMSSTETPYVAESGAPAAGANDAHVKWVGQHGNYKRPTMPRRFRNRIWRNSAAAAAIIAVIGGGLLTPFGQKVAAEAMQTFYVQQLAPINSDDIQTLQNALGFGAGGNKNFNLNQYGNVKVESARPVTESAMTLAQIEQVTGYTIPALPGASEGGRVNGSNGADAHQGTSYSYTPSATATLQLHVAAINQLLQQLGGTTMFPMSADNVPIVLTLPSQVSEYAPVGSNRQYASLTMMRVPSVEVPSEVDLNQVRQAVVTLPFMPSDIVSALEAENWDSTVYVPQTSDSHMATVDGQNVMISINASDNRAMAMWVKNGYFYHLSATSSQFPTDASILNAVKGISG